MKSILSFETAKALKYAGFPQPCRTTQQTVFFKIFIKKLLKSLGKPNGWLIFVATNESKGTEININHGQRDCIEFVAG